MLSEPSRVRVLDPVLCGGQSQSRKVGRNFGPEDLGNG